MSRRVGKNGSPGSSMHTPAPSNRYALHGSDSPPPPPPRLHGAPPAKGRWTSGERRSSPSTRTRHAATLATSRTSASTSSSTSMPKERATCIAVRSSAASSARVPQTTPDNPSAPDSSARVPQLVTPTARPPPPPLPSADSDASRLSGDSRLPSASEAHDASPADPPGAASSAANESSRSPATTLRFISRTRSATCDASAWKKRCSRSGSSETTVCSAS